MKLLALNLTLLTLLTVAGLVTTLQSAPPASGSFSDPDIEHGELKVAFEKILEENQQLRDTLAETQKTLADMRENLASANGEREVFKRQALELKLRIEALGLETAGGDNAKVEQRLLAAVRDLRDMAEQQKKLSEALIRLTDAASLYAKGATGNKPDERLALEMELRNAATALGGATPNAVNAAALDASISDGMAISIKDDLALVVMNIGSKHGVKVGMPFEVIRGGEVIGSIRVVDVREGIAGAIVQNLNSERERIQVGDRLKVNAQR